MDAKEALNEIERRLTVVRQQAAAVSLRLEQATTLQKETPTAETAALIERLQTESRLANSEVMSVTLEKMRIQDTTKVKEPKAKKEPKPKKEAKESKPGVQSKKTPSSAQQAVGPSNLTSLPSPGPQSPMSTSPYPPEISQSVSQPAYQPAPSRVASQQPSQPAPQLPLPSSQPPSQLPCQPTSNYATLHAPLQVTSPQPSTQLVTQPGSESLTQHASQPPSQAQVKPSGQSPLQSTSLSQSQPPSQSQNPPKNKPHSDKKQKQQPKQQHQQQPEQPLQPPSKPQLQPGSSVQASSSQAASQLPAQGPEGQSAPQPQPTPPTPPAPPQPASSHPAPPHTTPSQPATQSRATPTSSQPPGSQRLAPHQVPAVVAGPSPSAVSQPPSAQPQIPQPPNQPQLQPQSKSTVQTPPPTQAVQYSQGGIRIPAYSPYSLPPHPSLHTQGHHATQMPPPYTQSPLTAASPQVTPPPGGRGRGRGANFVPPPNAPSMYSTPGSAPQPNTNMAGYTTPASQGGTTPATQDAKRKRCTFCGFPATCGFKCCKTCCVSRKYSCTTHAVKEPTSRGGYKATNKSMDEQLKKLRAAKETLDCYQKQNAEIHDWRTNVWKEHREAVVQAADDALERYCSNAELLKEIFDGEPFKPTDTRMDVDGLRHRATLLEHSIKHEDRVIAAQTNFQKASCKLRNYEFVMQQVRAAPLLPDNVVLTQKYGEVMDRPAWLRMSAARIDAADSEMQASGSSQDLDAAMTRSRSGRGGEEDGERRAGRVTRSSALSTSSSSQTNNRTSTPPPVPASDTSTAQAVRGPNGGTLSSGTFLAVDIRDEPNFAGFDPKVFLQNMFLYQL